jgi:hypothetical protein
VLRAVAGWWDGIELWLTQLPFAFQVVLVVGVVAPVCWVLAAVIDTLVERSVAARLGAVERRSQATRAGGEDDDDADAVVDEPTDTAPAPRARPDSPGTARSAEAPRRSRAGR